MIRISHITTSASSLGGGISIAVQALAMAQRDAGVEARVIGQRDGGTALAGWPEGMLGEVTTHRLPGMPWSFGMADEIESQTPDLLHIHGLWAQPSIVVPRVGKRQRLPYLVSPHGMLDRWALEHSRWKKRLAGLLFERVHLCHAACLHALCRAEGDSIRAYGLTNPMAIIPNGVDLPKNEPERLTIEGRKSEGGETLLFLGRLHPKKGLVNALRAWAEVTRGSESVWRFVIAGWDQGGHEAELKELCRELDVPIASGPVAQLLNETLKHRNPETPASVLFVGPAFGEQKDALLRRAGAFVLPSFSEGLPMAVLEAWAHRLPVLMTDHCNLPQGFDSGAAIRIETNPASVTEGLRTLFASSASSLQAMGGAGRLLVEERFTWTKVAEEMKEVYEWVLGGGPKPECMVTP